MARLVFSWRKALPWAGYGAFILVVFAIGLLMTFPFAQVVRKAVDAAARESGWTVTMSDPAWSFPAHFVIADLTAQPPGGDAVHISRVTVGIHPLALFSGLVEIDYRAAALGGQLSGRVDIRNLFARPAFIWNGEASGLDLAVLPLPVTGNALAPWARGLGVGGRADFHVTSAWRGGEAGRGNGSMTLALSDFVLVFPNAPMGRLMLPLGKAQAEASWERGRVDVKRLSLDGQVTRGDGEGMMFVTDDPRINRLDLHFTGSLGDRFPMRDLAVSLLHVGNNAVTISLKGTMAQPMVMVNGMPITRMFGGV